VDSGVDAVIRSGTLSDSRLVARRLGGFRFVLCAAPGYLARAGIPDTPAGLAGHACIRYRFPATGKLQPWSLAEESSEPPGLRAVLTCNNMEAVREAVVAGFGIGYVPDFLIRDLLAAGLVATVLDAHVKASGQFSILWPSSRLMTPKLRVFIDFVSDRLFDGPQERST